MTAPPCVPTLDSPPQHTTWSRCFLPHIPHASCAQAPRAHAPRAYVPCAQASGAQASRAHRPPAVVSSSSSGVRDVPPSVPPVDIDISSRRAATPEPARPVAPLFTQIASSPDRDESAMDAEQRLMLWMAGASSVNLPERWGSVPMCLCVHHSQMPAFACGRRQRS